MSTRAERVATFRALHRKGQPFVVANASDAGFARLFTQLGFQALATTSSGLAFTLGRTDTEAGLADTLANCRAICAATHLPVSADLENGFADAPEDVARTIRLAAETGLAGGSIEDATAREDDPIYDFTLAVERVQAAVEAARAVPGGFVLTARAENYLHGRPDEDDTLRRLEAFQAAGADVLFAPLQPTESIARFTAALSTPLNVLVSGGNAGLAISDLAALGVARISVGGALTRVAIEATANAAREILGQGTFTYGKGLAPFPF
ncbi:isocitrate lyase/PEP mutase family protein [Zavarzinia sp. CC-PAN008]|uniref:isocitrate lyase/PEP mutase family protein n=1 Tax=Zavarzinia sp. CC-PAN008 TaxID=3243332 RepID=UPI003F7475D9